MSPPRSTPKPDARSCPRRSLQNNAAIDRRVPWSGVTGTGCHGHWVPQAAGARIPSRTHMDGNSAAAAGARIPSRTHLDGNSLLVRESLLAPTWTGIRLLVRESLLAPTWTGIRCWCENPFSHPLGREFGCWCENPFSHPHGREFAAGARIPSRTHSDGNSAAGARTPSRTHMDGNSLLVRESLLAPTWTEIRCWCENPFSHPLGRESLPAFTVSRWRTWRPGRVRPRLPSRPHSA
jgi:hypothetical protein